MSAATAEGGLQARAAPCTACLQLRRLVELSRRLARALQARCEAQEADNRVGWAANEAAGTDAGGGKPPRARVGALSCDQKSGQEHATDCAPLDGMRGDES